MTAPVIALPFGSSILRIATIARKMRPAKVNLRAAPHSGGSSTLLYRTATKLLPPITATPISAVTTSLSGLDGTFCPPSHSVLIHLGILVALWPGLRRTQRVMVIASIDKKGRNPRV